ncbi:hypothetical protein [Corallococcus silvisoli]|uniref:hypothetical protein n=1 Tax=Corallococcus silvisoli TaxID=2697031 RepID=UPI0013789CE6|nr:hypothetical protein [Corallococcus silvisoli]NBD07837.1 hypothetical protein [Corallococcus silvisoli]
MASRGEDVRGAVAQVCRDAARLVREGQAARAYSGLVAASRSLPMTPRLAAVLVRCALKAGTERAVVTLLDAAMVSERGVVRREVRRQLSRVLRRTGQEARAAAVLNGLLMDAPDDARARFVLDVLRERVAKAKEEAARQHPGEDEESRTKTVEVSALALSDPELGNTVVEMPVVEMPVVAVPVSPVKAPRAVTVQVPLGEWAGLERAAARGPEFPWEDDGPGRARVVTPPEAARARVSGGGATAGALGGQGSLPPVLARSVESSPDAGRSAAPSSTSPVPDAELASRARAVASSGTSLPADGVQVMVGREAAASHKPTSADAARAWEAEPGVNSGEVALAAAARAWEAEPGVKSGESSLADMARASEVGTAAKSGESSLASAAQASEVGTAAKSVESSLADTARASEVGTAAKSVESSLADTARASEVGTAAKSVESSLADTARASEVGTAAKSVESSLADTARASEVGTAAKSVESSLADTARASEVGTAAKSVESSLADTARAPEVEPVAKSSESFLSDTARVSEGTRPGSSGVSSPVDGVPAPEEMPVAQSDGPSSTHATAASEEAATSRLREPVSADAEPLPGKSVIASSEPLSADMPSDVGTPFADASVSSPVDVAQASVQVATASSQDASSKGMHAPVERTAGENVSAASGGSASSDAALLSDVRTATAADASSPVHVPQALGEPSPFDGAAASEKHAVPTSNVSSPVDGVSAPEVKPAAAAAEPRVFEVTQAFGKKLVVAAEEPLSTDGARALDEKPMMAATGASPVGELPASDGNSEAASSAAPFTGEPKASAETPGAATLGPSHVPAAPDAVRVPGESSKALGEDGSTSESTPKVSGEDASTSKTQAPRAPGAVLVPGAPSTAFDEDEATSEITPPERVESEKAPSASALSRDEKPRAQPPASARRATVLVPAASNPAFEEEESTSEGVPPQVESDTPRSPSGPERDSSHIASGTPAERGTNPEASSSVRTAEEGSERAQSQRQEAQLIARRAWRELAQLYLKRADRAKDAPERAEALTRLAEVMENELQDSAGAARMYREIVELTGERTALREQVRLLSQREDASLVRRALDDAISRARTSRARAVALLTRGERQLNMGAPAKARVDFEAADALVPGMLPVLAGLVRCVSDEERFAQVERLRAACAAAPRRAPDRLDALRVLAQVAEESLGDLRIAQWAWAEVLAESPDNEQPREHLLALARRLGDLPALSQLLHAQLAREPRGPAARKAHLERVATLEAMGDAGAALAELRQAVRFEPGHKEAWLLLADRCTEREQMGEAAWALENAATATEDDEERQHTWERLALFCREVLHNTDRARTYARRAESLRKSREQRARPPPPEPPRPAPPQASGMPPPSVLVAPPVATGRAPANRKDLSDEVTSNTDVQSLMGAEEAPPAEAPAKRSSRTKEGSARKSADAGTASPTAAKARKARATGESPEASGAAASPKGRGKAASAKAPSGSQAPVGAAAAGTGVAAPSKASQASQPPVADASLGAEAARRPKTPSGRHDSVSEPSRGAEASRQPKSPSGSHAPVGAASAGTPDPRQPKSPSGSHAPVGTASAGTAAPRQPKSPSGRHAPAGAPSQNPEAQHEPQATAGRPASVASPTPKAEAPRRAPSAKAPTESPPSLAEAVPGPSTMARASKPSRGTSASTGHASEADTPDHQSRAPASPRESTTGFGASLSPEAERESPPPAAFPPTPRKASAPSPTAAADRASAPDEGAPPSGPSARSSGAARNAAGTQVREALPNPRVERAPRAGHAPRAPLSASGVEPPAAAARAPLSASGVEPPAAAPRAIAGASRPAAPPARGRGAPEAPPFIPTLDQIPDEDEDSEELGGGPVEATSVIAWEAPPGRMDPVRRIHRAGRPEGTVSGPAPTRPPSGGRTIVGAAETRETPAVPDAAAAPPAEATSAEPLVFKLVRERPLDPKPYRGLVDHFDQRGDTTRAALMRELADALDARDVSAPRVQRGPLTNQERAGLRHPGLRTPSGELLACVGIALCRLFPSPARIASTSEPLRASAGPGASAVLDALHTVARLLGVPLPELVAGDDDTAHITPVHTTVPRLVVGRLLVQQPPSTAELRFHAGRALFSLSPDLLALRALRKDHLLRALALLSSVLRNPKDAGDDARVVRESLSPRALERAALLMEPGTRDFDATLLVAAARDSANRAGLVACGGPGPALTVLRARRPHDSELEELVRFAASERYLALRDPAEAGRSGA